MAFNLKMLNRIKTVHKCRKVHFSPYLIYIYYFFLMWGIENKVIYALVH